MDRKFTIFVVILLLLAAGGVFWWWTGRSDEGRVLGDEYIQTEINGEKIIEYKKTGFIVKIPGDWEVMDSRGIGLLCLSSDFQFHEKVGRYSPPIPEKGCSVGLSILKEIGLGPDDYIQYDYIQSKIEWCMSSDDCDDEVIEVGGNRALKHTYCPEDQLIPGCYVAISVPKNEITYKLEAYLFSQDREKCAQEFDKILQTVEIRK